MLIFCRTQKDKHWHLLIACGLFPALRGSDLDLSSLGAEIAQRKEELRTELGAESAG